MLLQPKAPTALVRRSPVTFSLQRWTDTCVDFRRGCSALDVVSTELHSIRCVGISFVPCVPLRLLGVSRLFDAIHSNALVLACFF